MSRTQRALGSFGGRTRITIIAILITFAAVSAGSALLSIWTTNGSRDRGTVIEVAARQRMLADRYVADVGLLRAGEAADPRHTGVLLAQSARALLNGGVAPASTRGRGIFYDSSSGRPSLHADSSSVMSMSTTWTLS